MRIAVTITLTLPVALAGAADATTFYVNGACGTDAWTGLSEVCAAPDGPKATIQAGVDAVGALGTDGHEIVVAPGTYNETVTMFPGGAGTLLDATLRSSDGPDVTIIDATGLIGHALNVEGCGGCTTEDGTRVVEGLTVRGAGSVDGAWSGVSGNSGTIVFRDCIIEDNDDTLQGGGQGGGLYMGAGDPTRSMHFRMEDCIVRNNVALSQGGGLFLTGVVTTYEIVNSRFEGNTLLAGASGLGVFVFDQTGGMDLSGTMRDCVIIGNGDPDGTASRPTALGVFGSDAFIEVVNTRILGNEGIGVNVRDGAGARFTNCVIAGNRAYRGAGVLTNRGATAEFVNSVVTGNESYGIPAFGSEASGIYVRDQEGVAGTPATLRNTIVWGNLPEGTELTATEENGPGSTSIFVEHSAVEGGPAYDGEIDGGWAGAGNIDAAPRFVDPDGPDDIVGNEDDDYRLAITSPAIDAGDDALVTPDVLDLDGDLDTGEPTPLDLDGVARFIDGDGDGTPTVDMGAYEHTPTAEGMAGPREWTNELGGAFEADANWAPDAPATTDAVVFGPEAVYTVSFAEAVAASGPILVADGEVTFALAGNTYTAAERLVVGEYTNEPVCFIIENGTVATPSARIGGRRGSLGLVEVPPGSCLAVTAGLQVGATGTGTLHLTGGDASAATVDIRNRGFVTGTGTVISSVSNIATIDPGDADPAILAITGSYDQSALEQDTLATETGTLLVDIAGATTGEYDALAITGTANLGGGFVASLDPAFENLVEEGHSFAVISAANVTSTFGASLMPRVPEGLAMRVNYEPTGVTLGVETAEVFDGFSDPTTFALDAGPTAAVRADFDGMNGVDVAIALPGADAQSNGTVTVLLNLGVDPDSGMWLGFDPATIVTPVGRQPVAMATARLDGDADLDLVVTNQGDGTVSVLLNDIDGAADTFTVMTFDVGFDAASAPAGVAAGDFGGDSIPDLAVTLAGENRLLIFENDGNASFNEVGELTTGQGPGLLDPEDVDEDRDLDIVYAHTADDRVFVALNESSANAIAFAAPVEIPVAGATEDLNIVDMDGDGLLDIVAASRTEGTVSIALNEGGGVFAATVDLPLGVAPRSMAALDLEPDGDLDLAIVSNESSSFVRVVRNDTTVVGQVVLHVTEDEGVGEDPALALAGDLDGDTIADLITLNKIASGDLVTGSVTGRVNQQCAADLDGSGAVDFGDILALLSAWGQAGGPEDLDMSGSVDFGDILIVLGNWGPCA